MDGHAIFIEVRIYRLVMISIDLSEKAQKSTLEIQDKIQSEIKSENFFPDKTIFLTKKKFLRFCLGLNFVSDYIPQLYFVCTHLIFM